jgi:hypothetical protein
MTIIPALIVAFSNLAHPMHVSYTNVEINTDQKTILVSHKLYTADFSLLFYHLFEKNIEPRKDIEFTTSENNLISSYMKQRFNIVAGNDTLELHYVRKDHEDESLFLYYKGKFENDVPEEIVINNLLLLDLYMDQKNLVIVNYGKKEQGLTFNWDTRQSVLVYKDNE